MKAGGPRSRAWIVGNPDAVKNFPAAHVVLEGKFNSAKKTIHVEKAHLRCAVD